ncbi:hypothetical protein ACFL35_09320 [Candidatus Riflebacteria bacterium]
MRRIEYIKILFFLLALFFSYLIILKPELNKLNVIKDAQKKKRMAIGEKAIILSGHAAQTKEWKEYEKRWEEISSQLAKDPGMNNFLKRVDRTSRNLGLELLQVNFFNLNKGEVEKTILPAKGDRSEKITESFFRSSHEFRITVVGAFSKLVRFVDKLEKSGYKILSLTFFQNPKKRKGIRLEIQVKIIEIWSSEKSFRQRQIKPEELEERKWKTLTEANALWGEAQEKVAMINQMEISPVFPTGLSLKGILISGLSKVACINNQVLNLEEKIDGYRLVGIGKDFVDMERNGVSSRLTLRKSSQ